ncbi:MAG: hypothetical protein Q4D27_05480, partial [Coriobacteriia bacterium]|nr:hypothetical protein [Coriobacteriia bacterium]
MKALMAGKKALIPIVAAAMVLAFGSGFAVAAHGGAGGDVQVSSMDAAPAAVKAAADMAGVAEDESAHIQVADGNANESAVEPRAAGYQDRDDELRVQNGEVYEYDDGRWEAEDDMKVEGDKVYEYDDGRWELEDDKFVEDGVVYENDDDAYGDDDDDYDDDD